MGSPAAFGAAVVLVVVWGAGGPYFDFSDRWQLIANTVTTLLTFLMVFLIQATQNRDAKATSVKLDELLRAVKGARTGFADLDALSDEQISKLEHELQRLGERVGVAPLGKPGAAESDMETGSVAVEVVTHKRRGRNRKSTVADRAAAARKGTST